MTDTGASDGGHEFLFHQPRALITARCSQCHRPVGTFWAEDPCEHHPVPDSGTWAHGMCSCTPAPRLPTGAELAKLVDRARRRNHGGDRHAAVTIRVC
ncbi:MAG: hypothetical protein QOI01_954 [Mycobacterium sp.]|jgi:hypothetical protein|nr:hypothetical protein [Mycobacterium sp.]